MRPGKLENRAVPRRRVLRIYELGDAWVLKDHEARRFSIFCGPFLSTRCSVVGAVVLDVVAFSLLCCDIDSGSSPMANQRILMPNQGILMPDQGVPIPNQEILMLKIREES